MNHEKGSLKLRAGNPADLARYLAKQADNLFPSPSLSNDIEALTQVMPMVLERVRPILGAVRNFTPDYLDHLNSLQHSSILFLVANEIFKLHGACELAERLYCSNRSLHAIDIFYKVEMPEVFFISHGLGSVLGNTVYGNYLTIFHNVTVGRVGDARPIIGNNVVLFPGATVTGSSVIGNGCVISAGTIINNQQVPDNTVVGTIGGEVIFRPRKRDIASLYFRGFCDKSEKTAVGP